MCFGVSWYVIIRTPILSFPRRRGKELGLEGQKPDSRASFYFDGSACLTLTSLVTLTFALTRLIEDFAEHHARHVEFVVGAAQ
jgi:hypothetical protein